MSDNIDFSLPQKKSYKFKFDFNGNIFIIIILLAILVLQVYNIFSSDNSRTKKIVMADKDIASEFENRGLYGNAVESLTAYIQNNKVSDDEKARLYYRIANLYMKKGEYENAIKFYFYSEKVKKIDEIKGEINRNLLECYRKSGNLAGLNAELASRSSLNSESEEKKNSEVLAEIGEFKITKADLDKKIQEMADAQIKQFQKYQAGGKSLSAEELGKQKEMMINSITGEQKNQILMQWVQSEILYRAGLEQGITNSTDFEKNMENFRKNYIAQQVMNSEIEKINFSENDYKDYYEAHKNDFKDPEKIKIGIIKCKTKEEAESVISKLKSGKNFEQIAQQFSIDEMTSKNGGRISYWMDRKMGVPGISNADNAMNHIFSLKNNEYSKTPLEADGAFFVFKVFEKQAEKSLNYDEARNRVAAEKNRNKEQEIMNQYIEKLKEKYKVILHYGKFAQPAATQPTAAQPVPAMITEKKR